MNFKRATLSFILLLLVSFAAIAQTGPRSLPRIASQADFDKLSVTYDANTPYALPHINFVIDRQNENKIYFVNKKRYSFHKDFVNGTYLSLERGREFFVNNYIKPNRRFILGTVAYQTPIKRWTFEFWEGDLIPADQIQLAYEVINKAFFVPVAFKPNSLRQDEASKSLAGVERVLQSDIARELRIKLNKADYDVGELEKMGLVEAIDTERRRGMPTTIYRAVMRPVFSSEEWGKLSQDERERYSLWVQQLLLRDIAAAWHARTFQGRAESHTSRSPLRVDELGWIKINQGLDDLLALCREVEVESVDRARDAGDENELINIRVAMFSFEMPSKADPQN